MTPYSAIIPKKNATSTRAGVKGAGATKAVSVQLLKGSKSKGVEVSNADFIAHAFAGIAEDETPWVAGFPGDVATADHRVWFGAPAIPMPRFIRPNHNNYVCVSTFHRADDGRYHRRKACWASLWMVLLDDLGTKVPFDSALRLKPSCFVETSSGNFQAWFFLKQPERDQHKAQALIDGLIAAGASDPGAGNLTRYGRLPTGINGKAKYAKDGQPFTQRVHMWEPSRRYAPEEIAKAYDFALAAASKPRPKRTTGTKPTGAGYVPILERAGLYLEPIRGIEGGHRIACPWSGLHSDGNTTGTAYFEPAEQNGMQGGFSCMHGNCVHRTIADLDWFIQALLRKTGGVQ